MTKTRHSAFATQHSVAGFTMIEVALALAIIAFGLVAIIGVLPSGMTVQRDNRWITIINEEGQFWLNAIRSGAREATRELTNNVQDIRIVRPSGPMPPPAIVASSTETVIGLLSRPYSINRAWVRALSGPAFEQGSGSLEYMMYVMITNSPPLLATNSVLTSSNLWDVRLVFRWPVYSASNVGKKSRKVFRTLVRGHLEQTNGLYYFRDEFVP